MWDFCLKQDVGRITLRVQNSKLKGALEKWSFVCVDLPLVVVNSVKKVTLGSKCSIEICQNQWEGKYSLRKYFRLAQSSG